MDRIEPAIGDVIEIDGVKCVCKVQSELKSCLSCAFLQRNCASVRCMSIYRQDCMNVYFELVTGENAEQKANDMEKERKEGIRMIGEKIREEARTKAAAESRLREEKARIAIEEENQSILNYLRDFLLRHNYRITEVKVDPEPLHLGLGKLVQVPADRLIIELKHGTQE